MKLEYKSRQLLILINQLLVVLLLSYEYLNENNLGLENILSLVLISLMLTFAIYIEFNNLKNNPVLTKFVTLLLFTSWVFLLLKSKSNFFIFISIILYIFLPYIFINFILFFIFHDAKYIYKKPLNIISVISFFTAISYFFNRSFFSILFMFQLIVSFISVLYIFFKHIYKVFIILKQEYKNILCSMLIIFIPYLCYILFNYEKSTYMSNIGVYFIISLPLFSMFRIISKNSNQMSHYYVLNYKKNIILSVAILAVVLYLGLLFKLELLCYFILFHLFVLLVLLYLILMYNEMETILKENNSVNNRIYNNNVLHITREENIKRRFSNYLHDNVIQCLLSIKNLLPKSHNQAIKQMILKIIDDLNLSIRAQIEEYHPPLLQNVTFKNNIENLIEMTNELFYNQNIIITLDCNDHIFLILPYDIIIYRIIRELLTNSFKHSKCSHIKIVILQNHDKINLIVSDNGIGIDNINDINVNNHTGLFSIQEQIKFIGGKINITSNTPQGLKIIIKITMRGDYSYEHFINR